MTKDELNDESGMANGKQDVYYASSAIRGSAQQTFAPEQALRALESCMADSEICEAGLRDCSESFLRFLGELLVISPPTQDALRSHPEWLSWLKKSVNYFWAESTVNPNHTIYPDYEAEYATWLSKEHLNSEAIEGLRAFKRREYLRIAYLDIAGLIPFEQVVRRLSGLAEWAIGKTLGFCWETLSQEVLSGMTPPAVFEGFAVIALGKLGGGELNYSSDVDLIFCRRSSSSEEELRFFTRLGERLIQALSRAGLDGFLCRVDMRLRPHGETGPLVPTIDNLMNYYESWGEAWERQALIKARFAAGDPKLGKRFQDFVDAFTFARQMDDSSLEEIKRVKHRSEKEYSLDGNRVHLKHGAGGIRDIEFYVQYFQLIAGWKQPEVRIGSTLAALSALAKAKVLLEGEDFNLSLAYIFLRTIEHRLQLQSLTPTAVLPESWNDVYMLAKGLGFRDEDDSAANVFLTTLMNYRARVRNILERIYLTPGYLRLNEREEEFAQLLSERTPKERVRELLMQYGFQDIDNAWRNIRLLALGPAGRLLPPGERRAFLEFVFPLLEVMRDSIDPDTALHNLEGFAAITGNRVPFLRTLASRRAHMSRLANLLALSNLCHQILTRHPEYFDSLARGIHLHQGRREDEMYQELQDRLGASPPDEQREIILRRFRQREMIRIAYRDMAGLADALTISRELSHLAEACVQSTMDWTRVTLENVFEDSYEPLHAVAMGKFGSRQMHYSSDLDLIFLYEDPPPDSTFNVRAKIQQLLDDRIENILELLAGVTTEGICYAIDLRLRPEGSAGLLARSYQSFRSHAEQYMQPWERMALVRSRILGESLAYSLQWKRVVAEVAYDFDWDDRAYQSIRHLKRRIESEKNKETRSHIDFKYGKGGITDLEFLVQFLQIRYGKDNPAVQTPGVVEAIAALQEAGAFTAAERDAIVDAHRFQREVENRYQLIEERNLREISRESPLLVRMARSLGYSSNSSSAVKKSFLSDWDENARIVRRFLEKYFYT